MYSVKQTSDATDVILREKRCVYVRAHVCVYVYTCLCTSKLHIYIYILIHSRPCLILEIIHIFLDFPTPVTFYFNYKNNVINKY